MFQILASLMLSFSVYAFDGQPKKVTVMPDLSTKTVLTLPELSVADLEIKKTTCREATCKVLATVTKELVAQVGTIDYKLKMAWVTVGRDGRPIEPFESQILILQELETGNRITLAHKENLTSLCFGKGAGTQNMCSYGVTEEVY